MAEYLKEMFQRSFEAFIDSDLESILANVNERNLCGRLSIHMTGLLEEYGLVLVVTVIATGMITFSETFKTTMQTTLETQWSEMTTGS